MQGSIKRNCRQQMYRIYHPKRQTCSRRSRNCSFGSGALSNLENLGLEELGIIIEKGKIKVDDYYKTNIEGIYAIGDIVHGPALAHVASAEGIVCVEKIAGHNPHKVDYTCIPSAYYTTPEVASVGLTERSSRSSRIQNEDREIQLQSFGKSCCSRKSRWLGETHLRCRNLTYSRGTCLRVERHRNDCRIGGSQTKRVKRA